MEAVEDKMIERRRPKSRSRHRLFQSEDVLINVLTKLPVKTLLRFRCVCKRWLYLISDDPRFFQLHSQHSKSKPLLLFSPSPPNLRKKGPHSMFVESMDKKGNYISNFKVKFKTHFLIPTRFDLVCINDGKNVQICNPSTHEFITLPKSPCQLYATFVGLGYVQSTDEYKVVRLIGPDMEPIEEGLEVDVSVFKTKCQVFNLGTGRGSTSSSSSSSWAWREVAVSPFHVASSSPSAFVNGAIHWMVDYDSEIDDDVYDGDMIDDDNTIIAFDVESEEFRLLPHPEDCPDLCSLRQPYQQPKLVELKGLLCLSCTIDSKMDMLMFKDYYRGSGNDHISGTWVKEYSIDLHGIYPRYDLGSPFHYYAPRDIDDTKVLIETHMKGVGYYCLQRKRCKEFMYNSREMPLPQFSFYVESLRSLKQKISTGEKIEAAEAKANVTN